MDVRHHRRHHGRRPRVDDPRRAGSAVHRVRAAAALRRVLLHGARQAARPPSGWPAGRRPRRGHGLGHRAGRRVPARCPPVAVVPRLGGTAERPAGHGPPPAAGRPGRPVALELVAARRGAGGRPARPGRVAAGGDDGGPLVQRIRTGRGAVAHRRHAPRRHVRRHRIRPAPHPAAGPPGGQGRRSLGRSAHLDGVAAHRRPWRCAKQWTVPPSSSGCGTTPRWPTRSPADPYQVGVQWRWYRTSPPTWTGWMGQSTCLARVLGAIRR